ncbi:related to Probable alpha-N-arabinofuranosidase A [Rhynchosporium secalis]|uniref:non-reducing end alpha-L-arabinofuranosidase n=1 Tax=Rhynchosporium secalis TaxID=38038 RepID=A0A1E1M1F8_RHYSE|nr:related to Probable alpha-N-arabinofuranosidase A [Rhynchosporium secalis]
MISKICLVATAALLSIAEAKAAQLESGLVASHAPKNSSGVSLSILTESGVKNKTAPSLYGYMFEDINHSGDGGLYGELLANRGFQGSNVQFGAIPNYVGAIVTAGENEFVPSGPVITGYKTLGNATIRLDSYRPLSPSHQTVLALDIPTTTKNTSNPVGFANMGWWGIPVSPQTYNVSFYVYPNQFRNQDNMKTSITVSLQSNLTGEIFASTVIPAQSWNVVNYTHIETQIVCNVSAPNSNNTLAITFDPIAASGHTYYFTQISLFGETFKGYKNGLRKDLAQHIYDLKPKFLRWPGGNNIEGYSFQTRWKWWETLGPLEQRSGRPGNWNYYNTNGMGILEFLEWTESMEMENVLAIFSGYSLSDGNGRNSSEYPGTAEAMYPVLKEALDELEFCMGDTSTYWGAKRAELGHPAPFKIQYIEIGNEDWFAKAYPFRFKYLYDGLKAAYPDITLISTQYDENFKKTGTKVKLPPGSMWDTHAYQEPQWFIRQFDFFDNWQEHTNNPNVTIMIGEYSVYQVDTPDGSVNFSNPPELHIQYPRMVSALAEGVYLLGAERNPNVVRLTSYAPSLQNWNWYNWTPNLFAFDADPAHTVLSTSYYLQKLFNAYRGTESLTVKNTKGHIGDLYWASSAEGKKVFLKIINTNGTMVSLTVDLEHKWATVNGTILSAPDKNNFNYKNNATEILPRPLNLTQNRADHNNGWTWNVPAYSITVLQFNV